jgi:hypothetical protein
MLVRLSYPVEGSRFYTVEPITPETVAEGLELVFSVAKLRFLLSSIASLSPPPKPEPQ